MAKLLNKLRDAARARAAYHRTASEIQNMPSELAHDLGIDRSDAARIAHKAVYGR